MLSSDWIWEHQGWPELHWQEGSVSSQLKQLYFQAGQTYSLCNTLDERDKKYLTLNYLLQSSGKQKKSFKQQLLSSLKHKLQLPITNDAIQSGHSQILAEAIFDSCMNKNKPFSLERLIEWHQAIEQNENSSLRQGKGHDGTDKVLFELIDLTEWFNNKDNEQCDPLIKMAVAYLRLACIKPFNDHNAEVCCMLSNLAFNQSFNLNIPLFLKPDLIAATNEQFQIHLDSARKGNTDITEWVNSFLYIVGKSLSSIISGLNQLQKQPEFWASIAECGLNTTQVDVLKNLLNSTGVETSISAAEYQKMTGLSKASATRHLSKMQAKGCISKLGAGGRSTRYKLNLNQDAAV
ncbi:MAG: DUF4172 domain-containing protein [Neptuniibacter sp.]